MTLTVHHLQVSQSERIPWLCEELGIPYELVLYKRDPLMSPAELANLTPLGSAPVITDTTAPYSEAEPLKLAESGAIAEYIVQRHGGGKFMLPPTHKDYVTYLYWWHFSQGSLQASMSRLFGMRSTGISEDHPMRAFLEKREHKIFKLLDEQLAKGPWLAGEEFTVADVMSLFSLTTMRKFGDFDLTGYDHLLAWMRRCGARPAYKKAMSKCDPDLTPALEAKTPGVLEPLRQMAKRG